MEPPKLPSVFKYHRNRSFNFIPRYYNEREERLEGLKKKYGEQGEVANNSLFKEDLKARWSSERAKGAKSSNQRLMVIIMILTVLAYLIITY